MSGNFQATKPHPTVGRLFYEREARRQGLTEEHGRKWWTVCRQLSAILHGEGGEATELRALRLQAGLTPERMAEQISRFTAEPVTAEAYLRVEAGHPDDRLNGWGPALWNLLKELKS